MTETTTGLEDLILQHLEDGDFISALEAIKREENQKFVAEEGFDKLVPLITIYMTNSKWNTTPQILVGCQELLCHIASAGNPKEVIISLSEHCGMYQDNAKVRHILPSLGIAFSRLGIKPASVLSLEDVLVSILAHVCHLKTIDLPLLEGKELLTLDCDEYVVEVCHTLSTIIEFLRIVSDLKHEEVDVLKKWHGVIVFSAILLLGNPLGNLLLDAGSSSRRNAEDLVSIVKNLVPNPLVLTNYSDIVKFFGCQKTKFIKGDRDYGFAVNWSCGVSMMFYLIFDVPRHASYIPPIYNQLHIFNLIVGNINLMMVDKGNYITHLNFVALTDHLLSGIPKASLESDILDSDVHSEFIKSSFKLIIMSPSCDVRKESFNNFSKYVQLFCRKGRLRLSKMILNGANHSGMIGYAISIFKDAIVEGLNSETLEEEFKGHSLQVVVRQFCKLQHKEQTELLEVSDEVMQSLNFLIFIFLRDKDDKTGIHALARELREGYLSHVEKAVDFSRDLCKMKLGKIKESGEIDVDCNLTVGGHVLPISKPEEIEKYLQSALTTLEMILNVQIRAREVIDSVLVKSD